jgi:hypothetical protein
MPSLPAGQFFQSYRLNAALSGQFLAALANREVNPMKTR